jgi:hypothetical protein
MSCDAMPYQRQKIQQIFTYLVMQCSVLFCSVLVWGDSPVGVPLHHTVCIEQRHRDSRILYRIVAISLADSDPHLRTMVLGEGGVLPPLLVPHSKEGGQVDQ